VAAVDGHHGPDPSRLVLDSQVLALAVAVPEARLTGALFLGSGSRPSVAITSISGTSACRLPAADQSRSESQWLRQSRRRLARQWRSGQLSRWKECADKGLRRADPYATHGPRLAQGYCFKRETVRCWCGLALCPDHAGAGSTDAVSGSGEPVAAASEAIRTTAGEFFGRGWQGSITAAQRPPAYTQNLQTWRDRQYMPLALKSLRRKSSLQNARFLLQTCLLCKVAPMPTDPIFTRTPTSLVRDRAQIFPSSVNVRGVLRPDWSAKNARCRYLPYKEPAM
jgi:hypothetical protein